MEVRFEKTFLKAVKKHAGIKKEIELKVRQIMERPIELGEPLKANLREFYSCPVKRNFLIIYQKLVLSLNLLYYLYYLYSLPDQFSY